MSDPDAYFANLHRGQMLREREHFQEACKFLGAAIEADPEQPQAYLELALAQSQVPQLRSQALATMDRAVALAPNSAHFIGYKAYLLGRYGKHKEALKVGGSALGIDPHSHIALLAMGNAYTKTAQWKPAEKVARQMLEMDAEDTSALNLLAQALRFQNRYSEAHTITEHILSRVPEDSFAQSNAGWEALKADNYIRANEHFLNALRADPHCEHARVGLLQSLRARMWIYRLNHSIMQVIVDANIGRFFGIAAVATGGCLLGPILLYLLIAFTLQPISNFFLLMEPTGQRALKPKERAWAWTTGAITAALVITLLVDQLWIVACFICGYFALFALSVYIPQWSDAWKARREKRLLERGAVS